ncbi:hypothetical protein IKJ53_03410, partial [bacterium]|nr:hypothetical protein [bacterium]
ILKKIPAMRGQKFTQEDYYSLSKSEKNYLRNILEKPLWDTTNYSSIRNDRDFFIYISENIKETLDAEYPDGWSLITLGGSPSLFAQILTFMGEDVKELPFSYEATMCSKFKNVDMSKYFNDLGITKEYLNDGKQKIVTDYVCTGVSLNKIREIMTENGYTNDNVVFEDLQDLLPYDLPKKENYMLNTFFLERENIKSYSTCPNMHYPEMYDVERMNNECEWNMSTKLMNFALIDYFEGEKDIMRKFQDALKKVFNPSNV